MTTTAPDPSPLALVGDGWIAATIRDRSVEIPAGYPVSTFFAAKIREACPTARQDRFSAPIGWWLDTLRAADSDGSRDVLSRAVYVLVASGFLASAEWVGGPTATHPPMDGPRPRQSGAPDTGPSGWVNVTIVDRAAPIVGNPAAHELARFLRDACPTGADGRVAATVTDWLAVIGWEPTGDGSADVRHLFAAFDDLIASGMVTRDVLFSVVPFAGHRPLQYGQTPDPAPAATTGPAVLIGGHTDVTRNPDGTTTHDLPVTDWSAIPEGRWHAIWVADRYWPTVEQDLDTLIAAVDADENVVPRAELAATLATARERIALLETTVAANVDTIESLRGPRPAQDVEWTGPDPIVALADTPGTISWDRRQIGFAFPDADVTLSVPAAVGLDAAIGIAAAILTEVTADPS